MRQLTIKKQPKSQSNRGRIVVVTNGQVEQKIDISKEDRYFKCRSIIPAEFLDHVLRVADDFARKLNGVDPAHDERICLHWITTGEWRAATQQHSVLGSLKQ